MTPRSLFNIILKILGLLFIKIILEIIPQIISIIFFMRKSKGEEVIWTLIATAVALLIYVLISYFLIFKSELIINKLKLDKGFDQESIPINMHYSSILSISIIVIGGLILADEIPNLCRQLFSYFQQKRLTYGQTSPTPSYIILSGAKIIIGLLLIGNQRQIVNYIEYKRRK